MKKLLLSLLVALGSVTALNAIPDPYAQSYGQNETTVQQSYSGSKAQQWKEYYRKLAAYRREVAAGNQWKSKVQTERWQNGMVNPGRQSSYANSGMVRHNEAVRMTPKVNKNVAQELCQLMNKPKNFKSLNGRNHAHDCRCNDGRLTCKTSYEVYSSVDTSKTRSYVEVDFTDPKNHPIIQVTKDGGLELMPLKRFEMEKAYQEKYIDPADNKEEKIYMKK